MHPSTEESGKIHQELLAKMAAFEEQGIEATRMESGLSAFGVGLPSVLQIFFFDQDNRPRLIVTAARTVHLHPDMILMELVTDFLQPEEDVMLSYVSFKHGSDHWEITCERMPCENATDNMESLISAIGQEDDGPTIIEIANLKDTFPCVLKVSADNKTWQTVTPAA